MAKRVLIYTRVSTDEQADKGGLPSQLRECQAYCERQGWTIAGEFSDDYTGTVKLWERPEGAKAFAMLKTGQADILLAHRMSRIMRPKNENDEWPEVTTVLGAIWDLGLEIWTVRKGEYKNDFAGRLIAVLDAKEAGEDRRDIIERLRNGKTEKAHKGRFVGAGGRAPYGYTIRREFDEKKMKWVAVGLDILESQAAVVRQMYKWYVAGDDPDKTGPDGIRSGPMTPYAIASRLHDLKIETPAIARGWKNKRRRNGPCDWLASTVYDILASETYAGVWHWNKTSAKDRHVKAQPKENHVAVACPPIVDRGAWDLARAKLELTKSLSNHVHQSYLLRGLVFCGCGYRMAGKSNGQHSYYVCRSEGITPHQKKCPEKIVRADLLDSLSWTFMLDLFLDRATFEQNLQAAQKADLEALTPKREQLERILAEIVTTDDDIDDIAKALKNARGRIAEKLQKQAEDANTKYETLCKRRDDLRAEIAGQVMTDAEIVSLLTFRDDVIDGFCGATEDDKRFYLTTLRATCTVKDRKATFTCRLPLGSRTYDLEHPEGCSMEKGLWKCTASDATRFITLTRTYDLDEIARAFFAKTPRVLHLASAEVAA